MKKHLRAVSIHLSTLCLAAVSLLAQAAPPPENVALARELVEVSRFDNSALFREQMKTVSPESNELMDALIEEMDWDRLHEQLVPIYARNLSADELRAAIELYRSGEPDIEDDRFPEMPVETVPAMAAWMGEEIPAALETLAGRTDLESPVLDTIRQHRTVKDLVEVGTALMHWLSDTYPQNRHFECERGPEPASWRLRASAASDHGIAVTAVPYEKIRELLIPEYLERVPERDGWGRSYQFAINEDLRAGAVLSIRSPGKDGEFDTDDYVVGSFDIDAYDNDIVWIDGYMGRWPARAKETVSTPAADPAAR